MIRTRHFTSHLRTHFPFLRKPTFCSTTPEKESPELPVWFNSPTDSHEDDFHLPTKLDILTNYQPNPKPQTPTKPPVITISDSDIVGKVLKNTFPSPASVVQALNSNCRSVKASKALVESMLKRFNNDWIAAFGFFNWADSQENYAHSAENYDAMVDVLGKARRFELMWTLVDEMVRVGSLVSLRTIGKVMRRLAGAGRWDDAVETFRVIERFGVAKDTAAMNVVLDTLCKERSVKRAWSLFLELRDRIPPDVVTFNALVHGWCKAGKMEEARWMVEEMRRSGFSPCVITYTCLVEAYCSMRDFCEVESVMREMESRGCPPNVITYTIVMQSLGKAKETQEALLVYEKMKASGCCPDTGFYNSLICILGRAGRLRDAYDVFSEMNRTGILPNVSTYNNIITAACEHLQEELALKLLHEMEESSCKPDLKTFSPLLKMGCRGKTIKILDYLLDCMFRNNISLDLGTYSLLVNGLFKEGELDKACSFFEEMVLKGMLPRNQTYIMLVAELERRYMEKAKAKIEQLMAMAHRSTRCEVSSPRSMLSMSE